MNSSFCKSTVSNERSTWLNNEKNNSKISSINDVKNRFKQTVSIVEQASSIGNYNSIPEVSHIPDLKMSQVPQTNYVKHPSDDYKQKDPKELRQ